MASGMPQSLENCVSPLLGIFLGNVRSMQEKELLCILQPVGMIKRPDAFRCARHRTARRRPVIVPIVHLTNWDDVRRQPNLEVFLATAHYPQDYVPECRHKRLSKKDPALAVKAVDYLIGNCYRESYPRKRCRRKWMVVHCRGSVGLQAADVAPRAIDETPLEPNRIIIVKTE